MADPFVVECSSACTVTIVHEVSIRPLDLTLGEAALIASAILAVWALAWVFRTLGHTILSDGNSTNES